MGLRIYLRNYFDYARFVRQIPVILGIEFIGIKQMKKQKMVITVIIFLILLIPVPTKYKDGGSVRYKAVLYDITKYNRLDLEAETGYNDGWNIKILGVTVYNNFN